MLAREDRRAVLRQRHEAGVHQLRSHIASRLRKIVHLIFSSCRDESNRKHSLEPDHRPGLLVLLKGLIVRPFPGLQRLAQGAKAAWHCHCPDIEEVLGLRAECIYCTVSTKLKFKRMEPTGPTNCPGAFMSGVAKKTDTNSPNVFVVVHLTERRCVRTAQTLARAQPKPRCLAQNRTKAILHSPPKFCEVAFWGVQV